MCTDNTCDVYMQHETYTVHTAHVTHLHVQVTRTCNTCDVHTCMYYIHVYII